MPLQRLLTTFTATCLGESDINAGANLLSAMAITLSNIARTGSGLQEDNLPRMQIGTNLLVSGGLSASLIQDTITREVAIRQNNFTSQLRRFIGDKLAATQKNGCKSVEYSNGPPTNHSENALYQLGLKDDSFSNEQVEQWSTVLEQPPNPRIEDLAVQPKILVTVKNPKNLEEQLRGLHGNRPLISLNINSPGDVRSLSETCSTLIDGLYPCGHGGETATAHLLVSDPRNVLAEIAPNACDKTVWLGNMVWLVDGDRGACASEDDVGEGHIKISNTGARFGEALSHIMAKRLNNHDASPVVHNFKLGAARFRWVKFLQEMETQLPGITMNARGLLPSLAFGLIELAQAPHCPRLKIYPEDIEELAQWIITRMANARMAFVASAERDRQLKLARRILSKLNGEQSSARDLYRALGINSDLCENLLLELESAGLIRQVNKKWEKAKEGILLEADTKTLFLKP